MALMTKDEILAVDDRGHEDVDVPGWGMVRLKALSGTERAHIEQWAYGCGGATNNPGGFRGQVLVRCLVGGDDVPLFDEKDIGNLMGKAAAPLEFIFDRACELNGFRDRDVKELEKNSPSGRNGDSLSG